MNPDDYQMFTRALQRNLEQDDRVIGLLAVGSMAATSHQPDEWSDHDFTVIVRAGTQEDFRTDLRWLPDANRIAYWFRETEHGIKAIYEDGHLIEFAVFDLDELRRFPINTLRMLIDRDSISDEAAQRQAATTAQAGHTDAYLIGQFMTNLLVAAGRYRRGEQLSARILVNGWAMMSLLRLLARYLPPSDPDKLDNLDPFRRFEFAYPEIGAELNRALRLDPPLAALALLDAADRLLRDRMSDYPAAAYAAVRGRIAAAASHSPTPSPTSFRDGQAY